MKVRVMKRFLVFGFLVFGFGSVARGDEAPLIPAIPDIAPISEAAIGAPLLVEKSKRAS